MEDDSADQGGAGDGEDPGPDDAAGDAPADGSEAAGSAYSDDGAGDGVSSADRDAEDRVHYECEAAGSFRGESAEGRQLGDALAHGLDDAPAAGHGAAAHRQVAADDNPEGGCGELLQRTSGHQRGGDNAHAFLCVIRSVAEAKECGRDELKAAEDAIDLS